MAFSHARMRLAFLLVISGVLAVGCDDGGGGTEDATVDSVEDADTQVDVPDSAADIPVGTTVTGLFDLTVATAGESSGFYDFPFPSDLRLQADGRPDMNGFPSVNAELIRDALAIVTDDHRGFTPNGATYFRFDGALDPATLPASAADSIADDATAFIIDIDATSPEQGRRVPAYVHFEASRSAFWRSNMVSVRPVPGVGMRPGTRYAVGLTDGLRSEDGGPVVAAESLAALRDGGTGDAALADHYAATFGALDGLGFDTSRIVALTSYTTSDVALEMDALRQAVLDHPSFAVTGWTKDENSEVYYATFETLEFFGEGTPPFDSYLGEGRFVFAEDGTPTGGTVGQVTMAITVPTGDMPAEGYPLVIYGHGTGGDHETHLGAQGEGSFLALESLATLGFDAALHGNRVEGDFDYVTLLATNPIAAREVVRQTVVDTMVLYRLHREGALVIPDAVTGRGDLSFEAGYNAYMGHSQGAQEAGVLLGVEPDVEFAFLSAGGAGLSITIQERSFNGTPIVCTLALLIGVDCNSLTPDSPLLTLVVQPVLDGADPLNFAHRFNREPIPGAPARHIVMSQGILDQLTPPRSQDALAMAIGLPLVEPVYRTSDPVDLTDPPRETPPVANNVMTPNGPATGGMVQYTGEGHFAIYDNGAARNRYLKFFRTSLGSQPTIVE